MRIKEWLLLPAKLLFAAIVLSPAIYLFFCFCFVPYHFWVSGWRLPYYDSLEYVYFSLGCFVWVFALAALLMLSPLILVKIFPSLEKREEK